jgi:hypothetical protein
MTADLQKTVKKRTSNIPRKDADLVPLGKGVGTAWSDDPDITLKWTTVAKYKADVLAYDAALNERLSTGGERKEKTGKLSELDTLVDEGITWIKGALVYKYGKKNAPSYYPQFGIVKHGTTFIITRDRSQRLASLALTLAAVTTHGMAAEKYGTAYWQQIINSYTTLQNEAAAVDGTVASKVSTKNELRANILKTNNALILVLKGNYPDTWQAVIREWGFQKEKY